MKRRDFIAYTTMLSGMTAFSPKAFAQSIEMKLYFLRHATFILEMGDVRLLIDPMLSKKEAMDPVSNAANSLRIPMVNLPVSDDQLDKLLSEIDAVIITHTHRDHWDARAQELIDKNLPLIIQPSDEDAIREKGFTNLKPVNSSIDFNGLKITRTGGQHGTGEIGIKMGHVSGFVIERRGKKIYIAGDTVWCTEVEHAIGTHNPNAIVVNAGAAQFLKGGPITMSGEDVVTVCNFAPQSRVVAVHMDTVNHCLLKRSDLKKILEEKKLTDHCVIPNDGETVFL